LVAVFRANETFYLSPQFSEAQTRKDFLDKLFIALGWDVNHDTQKNPYEQEVKIEKNESGSPGRADYAFYLSPNFHAARFLVEAKKPHGEFGSAENYFQTLRYGWNSKTPLVILTNFDELHILDSRYKPHIGDTLSRVVKKFGCADYADPEKFAEIYWLFSREAVASNSLAKRAEELPKPKSETFRRELFKVGTQSPDEAFLIELDGYREMLAKALKSKNPNLNSAQLTELTQRVIDRLVFIRFLEDKQIEPTRHLERFGADGGSAWEDFLRVSGNLDRIYNGAVLTRHPMLDAPGFQIDERPFRIICEELADPTSPYNFATIPIHILGSIYERFLGKIITDGARAVEKPEVRKAGGVYYTPEYIVRYIVANTVGKAIEGKAPAEIAGMRFADIACGSGSFLLEVFDCLVRGHAKFYNENQGKAKKGDCVQRDDGLHLSLKKKQEILRNNIYGVDIDRQAVEVAQLSLYLKLLEEETIGSAAAFQKEFHFTLLPPLNENIVCGNSLIGTDILETGKFTPEEERKLNPMDFEQRFPQIFRRKITCDELHDAPAPTSDYTLPGVPLHGAYAKVTYKKKKSEKAVAPPEIEYEGGFDAIVGNPPYVRPHKLGRKEKQYFWKHYKTFTHKSDLYCCFIENATRLLKRGGLFSYIVSHGWLRLNSFQELRRFVLKRHRILELVEFPFNVFAGAQVATGVFVFEKSEANETHRIQITRTTPIQNGALFLGVRQIPQKALEATFQNVFDLSISPETEPIKDKMRNGVLIGDNFEICFGLKTGDDEKFLHYKKGAHKEDKPLLRGANVQRYERHFDGEYVWYVPKRMRANRQTARPGEPRRFEQPKILVKDTSSDFACAYDPDSFYVKDVLIVIPKAGVVPNYDLRFLAGVINSKALYFYYRTTFKTIHVQNEELASLPLPKIEFSNKADKARHDKLVSLVERMLETRQQLSAALTDGDRDFYTNKCDTLDRQIDALVYELYGLSSEEVKIVEGEKEISVGQPLSHRLE